MGKKVKKDMQKETKLAAEVLVQKKKESNLESRVSVLKLKQAKLLKTVGQLKGKSQEKIWGDQARQQKAEKAKKLQEVNSELAQAEKKGDVDTKWVKELEQSATKAKSDIEDLDDALEKKEAPPEPKKKDLKPEAKLALQSFKKKLEKAEDPQEALQKKHRLYKRNTRNRQRRSARLPRPSLQMLEVHYSN